MNRFALARPRSHREAAALLTDARFALPVLKAGGMDLLDHLKEGLLAPDLLIDIKRLREGGGALRAPISEVKPGALRIEANATLAEIAASPIILKSAPVLAQACGSAATPQVRNVATAAGNLLQRPRCWYYRNDQFDCLKKGGPICYAAIGENKYHAIFGDGPCHIVHPSNLAPALMVLAGMVHTVGPGPDAGPDAAPGAGPTPPIAIASLYHMPEKGILTEHNLEKGAVVTHLTAAAAPVSGFYAVKEKQSFDWPLVAAAVALTMDGDAIGSARVCAAAVAPVPWMLPNVAEALRGVKPTDDAALRKACARAVEGAKPMSDNAYKLTLLPVAVRRAVLRAAGLLPEEAYA